MMTGRKIELSKGTQLWPLNSVKDTSNDEQYLICFTGDKTISLPFGCQGKFVATSVYLRDLENGRLPKIVQMKNKVQLTDILSKSDDEARFLLEFETTPFEAISFKKTSVYVGFVNQMDTVNGKHILVIPNDFQQLDLELVNILTSSSPSILKEINDFFFSWTVGIDLECIHEKLFCVDNDPCFIYLKNFSENEDYVFVTPVHVKSAGSEQSLQKEQCNPMYANDLLFQTQNKDNVVGGENSNPDRTSPVPDLPPRKPRNKKGSKGDPSAIQTVSQQISIPIDEKFNTTVATEQSTSSIKDTNTSNFLRPEGNSDTDDYLTPISSKRMPAINKSDTPLNFWQLSLHNTVEENRGGRVDVKRDHKTFFDYNVAEVSACFKRCGLGKLGDVCSKERLDGEFFKTLTTKDFEAEPFCLSHFEIKKLVTIVVDGWRPREGKSGK
ncbi:hypothetical protein ACJMK2_040767 [Sinanodonta woodiana]|uniref:Uncharacterized protein n=1 Tax=Sinanodonta woodiana TaxID=1069815 RepID=A0ABD3W5Q4_SINWO